MPSSGLDGTGLKKKGLSGTLRHQLPIKNAKLSKNYAAGWTQQRNC
jgi:hypothetical protein